MAENEYYIVRGAKMQCDCGSHKRRINLPESHGSYVNGKPMMNEDDKQFTVNVPHFGICKSPSNQTGDTIYLISEEGATISGPPCRPMLLEKWMKTKASAKVEGKPALTTESLLVCGHKGQITFVNNGQQDE
ncbi:DUF4280 domain-containing protein [Paenibacillus rigui]|uniref:DUF4280 domain-containing protein n=1 Tax=Paenibacillus rigui TaxID=554312 RepID=A0A229UPG4_9BACL|nr:DUF4280 domain-containing protein [Paenibacillus rigui]OXM85376.1 hypothetical protein CF651_15275 [Paenibacillus rigui]